MIRVKPQSASVLHEAPMQASGLSPQGCGEFPPPPPMGRVGVAGPPAERVTVTVMTPGRVGVGWPGRGVLTTGLLPTLAHLPLTHPNWPSQSFSVWHVAPACAEYMSVTDLDTPPFRAWNSYQGSGRSTRSQLVLVSGSAWRWYGVWSARWFGL